MRSVKSHETQNILNAQKPNSYNLNGLTNETKNGKP